MVGYKGMSFIVRSYQAPIATLYNASNIYLFGVLIDISFKVSLIDNFVNYFVIILSSKCLVFALLICCDFDGTIN